MMTRLLGIFVVFLAMLFVAPLTAQDKAKVDPAALNGSLRDVINTGADLFNLQADHAGCYRLYQGSLLSIKPFLKADLQANVDRALAEAEKKANFAERAHHLRATIDAIRDQVKPAVMAPVVKKIDAKQVEGEIIRVPPRKIDGAMNRIDPRDGSSTVIDPVAMKR